MTRQVTPEQREKLAKKFHELSRFMWWDTISSEDDLERALILVDEIIKEGWMPPSDPNTEDTFMMEITASGDIYELPSGRLLPKSTPVVVQELSEQLAKELDIPIEVILPEEQWKNITIHGLESFQVSDIGRIRYKFNDKIIEPSFDCARDKHAVKLVVNGKPLFIDGPALAAVMWGH